MYNKNGLIALNAYITGNTGSGQSTSLSGLDANTITFSDGTKNTGSQVYVTYNANITTPSFTRFNITNRQSSGDVSVGSQPTNGYRVNVGYRDTDFTEDTFTLLPTNLSSYCSVTVTKGVPTITFVNSSAEDLIVNEVIFLVAAGNTTSDITKAMVFAGFHFPDITIAPGDSYTFTFSHKNA